MMKHCLAIVALLQNSLSAHDCDVCSDANQISINYKNHWNFDKDELCYAGSTTGDDHFWVCKGEAIRNEFKCPLKEKGQPDRLKFDTFLKTCIWESQYDQGNQLCINYATGSDAGDDTTNDVGVRIYLSNGWKWDVNLPSATLTLGNNAQICADFANSGVYHAPSVDHIASVYVYKTLAAQTWGATSFFVSMKNVDYHYRLADFTDSEKLNLSLLSDDGCDKTTTNAGTDSDMCEVTSWW